MRKWTAAEIEKWMLVAAMIGFAAAAGFVAYMARQMELW